MLCVSESKIRRLALVPWMIGFVSYFIFGVAAVYLHPRALELLGPSGHWSGSGVVQALLGIVIGALLFVIVAVLSLMTVIIVGAFFQSAIAAAVLELKGVALPSPIDGTMQEIVRSIVVESGKLLWLIPLGIIAFVCGLIPILAPVAFIFGSWLIAFQFFDAVFEALQMGVWDRLRTSCRNGITLVLFGALLLLLCVIPFALALLAPVAVAGAALLVADTKMVQRG